MIDSTGLKVFGEGEWKVRQHGYTKRRTWKKLHLCVNESNSEIISASFTDNSFKDNEVFKEMLEGMESKVSKVSGDGAYDAQECWDFCHSRGIKGIFPPRKGAKIKKHGNCKGEVLPRDEHIRMIRRMGKSGDLPLDQHPDIKEKLGFISYINDDFIGSFKKEKDNKKELYPSSLDQLTELKLGSNINGDSINPFTKSEDDKKELHNPNEVNPLDQSVGINPSSISHIDYSTNLLTEEEYKKINDHLLPITLKEIYEDLYEVVKNTVISEDNHVLPVINWRYDSTEHDLPRSVDRNTFANNPNTCIPLKNMFLLSGIKEDDINTKISEAKELGDNSFL